MNIEKVFTAFKKTGEEILIYRKKDNTYINLIDNKTIPNEEIDLSSLNYVENSLDLSNYLFKNIPKIMIKRNYEKDRKVLMDTRKIILGMEMGVTNLTKTEEYINWNLTKVTTNYLPVAKSMTLYKFDKEIEHKYDYYKYHKFDLYTNLSDYKNYLGFEYGDQAIFKMPNLKNGALFFTKENKTLEDIENVTYLEKKKVYEKAYEIKQKSLGRK